MPKMGESIEEATITNWFVKEGDKIEEDDNLLEIATDKVDSEIPSPVEGIVKKILFKQDEVVAVGTVIAVIDIGGEDSASVEEKTEELEEIHKAETVVEVPVAEVSHRITITGKKYPDILDQKSNAGHRAPRRVRTPVCGTD